MIEISFKCIKCGSLYEVPAEYAGQKMECGDCGTKQLIPYESIDASQPQNTESKGPHQNKQIRKQKRPPIPSKNKRKSPRPPAPIKYKKSGSSKGVLFLMISLAALAVPIYFIFKEKSKGKSKEQPSRGIVLNEGSKNETPSLNNDPENKISSFNDDQENKRPSLNETPDKKSDEQKITSEQPLPPPIPGTLQLSTEDSRPWHPYALGGNTKFLTDHPFTSTDNHIHNLNRLHLRTFRYPGGTAGNDWNWTLGTKGNAKFRYPPSEIAILQKKTGVEVLWMLNMLNKDINHNIKGLDSAVKAGADVRFIELGNEFYLKGDEGCHRARFPKGTDYGKECIKWINAVKRRFPNAEFAISDTMKMVGLSKTVSRQLKKAKASGRVDIQMEVAGGWSDQVAAACDSFDVHVIHHYSRALVAPGKTAPSTQGLHATPEELNSQWKLFHKPEVIKAFIGRAPDYWKTLTTTNNLPIDAKIWITEFGVNELIGVMGHTWANAMAVANAIGTYIDDGRVERFCFANFQGGWVYKSTKALRTKGLTRMKGDITTVVGEMTPCGKVNQMFGRVMNGKTAVQQLDFGKIPLISTGIVRPYPALKGWLFGNPGTSANAIIVNFSSEKFTIDTTALGSGKNSKVSQFGCPDLFRLFPRESQLTEKELGHLERVLKVPPYSITTVTGLTKSVSPLPHKTKILHSLSQDTYISKKSKDSNYALEAKLVIDSNSDAIIKFKIPDSVPISQINSVKLIFHTRKPSSGTIKAYALKTDLQSSDMTWASIPDRKSALVAVLKNGPETGTIEFDITKYITKPGRYALRLKCEKGSAELASIESKQFPILVFHLK